MRGLGSDATLTLLNGRRLPYDSALQGVDISAIPMDAVARIEVVPDGASALYGSDAVGGVVNVILRQDYSGITTRARITAPTDGGDFGQLFGAMAGAHWTGGGGYVAYEYNQNDALSSNERDTTRVRPNLTLLPSSRRHAVAGHLHQEALDNLTVELDALYNNRASAFSYPQNATSDPDISRTEQSFRSDTLATAAAAHLSLANWQISLTGTFGKNRSAFVGDVYLNDALAQSQSGRYDNRSVTGELSADGPLFSLPGGAARVALGTGIRDNHFVLFRGAGNIANVTPSQQIRYAFGEISLPFIGPANGIAWIRKLDLSAALRYEDYRAIAEIVTPKLGLIYAPSSAIDLKASWGRSFRAPSFVDQYSFSQASLYPASLFGGTSTPSNAAALFLQGGNTQLKPERARSWSATLAFHPGWLGRARIEIGYFDTRYVDRVVVPITQIAQALTNPVYAAQVTKSPTPAQLAAAIAGASQFTNATGAAYDPATIVALIDDTNTNAGIQVIRGLDAQAHYQTRLASGDASFDVDATYLTSRQQISPSQPVQTLAGTLFSPPHWRARGSATWARNGFRGVATVNYTGGVVDTRGALPVHLAGMTTVDLGARYTITRGGGLLGGIEVGLSLLNALDAMPPVISTTLFYETPYDSTNYSAVGRVVALEVSKSW